MRADRLISIVMLLQTRERMTAKELSQELEVSSRTIYRDITALNVAGIPIYTDRGPGGGIALLESYRTTLTGMEEDEARALFMLSIPQALVELGMSQKLKSALLKLAVALPPRQKMMQEQAQQRIYLDSTSWNEPTEPSAHLGVIHQAVWQDKLIRLVYHGRFDTQIEFEIQPIGLVAKMNTWYLVGKEKSYLRVFNIADILEVKTLNEGYKRDENFDLVTFWKGWCESYQNQRPVYKVRLRIAPTLITKLQLYLGETIKFTISDEEPEDGRGWSEVTILYENFFSARQSILNFGRAAEVLEPEALKISVIDFAQQIVDFYLPY
jgi:predicted DNA-binding transcriptional regulator YafY